MFLYIAANQTGILAQNLFPFSYPPGDDADVVFQFGMTSDKTRISIR